MTDLVYRVNNSPEMKQQFLDSLENDDVSRVFLCLEEEYEYWSCTDRDGDNILLDVVKHGKKKGYKVYILSATLQELSTPPSWSEVENDYVHLKFPTSFFNNFSKLDIAKDFFRLKDKNISYHFITLNSRPHWFRAYMIDELCKRDLLKFSRYTWHEESLQHKFQYYDGRKSTLDDFAVTRNQWSLPSVYHDAFAQLVSETAHDVLFLTEKTVVPIYMQTPFLCCAAPNFHRYLLDLGFELYTEIFDYGFDSVQDHITRFNLVIDNFERLTKYTLDDLKSKYQFLLPKLIRNRQRALDIADDRSFVPEVLYTIDKNILKTHNYFLYQMMGYKD